MIHIYLFNRQKLILLSDYPSFKIKNRYGHQYEILTSIKDPSVLSTILPRITRPYSDHSIIEWFIKERKPFTEEHRRKISYKNSLRRRSLESRLRTSLAMRGRSNFQGKRHSDETKSVMSSKALGNQRVAGLYWCHNPVTGVERRVKDRNNLPPGFILGRDYDSTESMVMGMKEYWKK